MRKIHALIRVGFWLPYASTVLASPLTFDETVLQDAGYLEAGWFRIYPALATSVGHDSNIFASTENEVSSTITHIKPELSALLPYNGGALQFGVQTDSIQYSESSDDDFTDKMFFARGNLEANHRNRFSFNGELCKCHEARGTELTEGIDPETTTITSPDEYTDQSAGLNYEFGARGAPGRLRFNANYLDHSYDNHRERTRYFDRDETGVGATFLWRVFPSTALAFEGRERSIVYAEERPEGSTHDSRETSLLIGAEWEATRATSGSLRVGKNDKNFDAEDRSDSTDVVWELSGKWQPRSYSRFELDLTRAPSESTGGGDFVDTKQYAIKWSHDWTERIGTQLTVDYSDKAYQSIDRDQQTKGLLLGVKYAMRHWLVWRLSADWHERSSDIDELQFERNRYWLSAEITL